MSYGHERVREGVGRDKGSIVVVGILEEWCWEAGGCRSRLGRHRGGLDGRAPGAASFAVVLGSYVGPAMSLLHVLLAVALTLGLVVAWRKAALVHDGRPRVFVVDMAVSLFLSRPPNLKVFARWFCAFPGAAVCLLMLPVEGFISKTEIEEWKEGGRVLTLDHKAVGRPCHSSCTLHLCSSGMCLFVGRRWTVRPRRGVDD